MRWRRIGRRKTMRLDRFCHGKGRGGGERVATKTEIIPIRR
jgi:hypothetical protein